MTQSSTDAARLCRVVSKQLPEYDRAAYTRGLVASNRAVWSDSSPLDNAGWNTPDEWYDGYHDAATGREKWHLPLCSAHHNNEGGCKQA